ncbi:MAG: 6,7-dimethyl-8-ribityllumazine synthase [Pirellulales bacterium]
MNARVFTGQCQGDGLRVGVVVSRYHTTITENLLQGCLNTLTDHGVAAAAVDVAWVPGAWELPVAAQRLAATGNYQAVICLGAVIRGETTHDQFINMQVSQSLGQIALQHDVPVLFGLLTCQSVEQALDRSGGRTGNKGSECALAALEMASLMSKLPHGTPDL